LQLIAHRRNQIVSEFGCDPIALGARHLIDLVLVTAQSARTPGSTEPPNDKHLRRISEHP